MSEVVKNAIVILWTPLLALSLWVLILNYRRWRKLRPADQGLLPQHVWLIAGSYLVAVTSGAYEVVIGDPFNGVQAAATVSSIVSGLAAMVVLLRYEQLRSQP